MGPGKHRERALEFLTLGRLRRKPAQQTLEELKGQGLVRRLLSPSFKGCLFQVGRLAFTCQLTSRPGMEKGRAREPGVAKGTWMLSGGP